MLSGLAEGYDTDVRSKLRIGFQFEFQGLGHVYNGHTQAIPMAMGMAKAEAMSMRLCPCQGTPMALGMARPSTRPLFQRKAIFVRP